MAQTRVKDLMTPHPVIIPPHATLMAAAHTMHEMECGILPVGTPNDIKGVLTDRDIVIRAVAEGRDITVETVQDYMTPGICCCHEDDTAAHAADLMREHHVNRLIVTSDDGSICGILTLGRIMREDEDMQEIAQVISRATGKPHAGKKVA